MISPPLRRWRNKRTAAGRFFANKAAVVGLVVLIVYMLAAVLAPLLAGHDPYKVNTSLLRKPPSTKHWFGTDTIGRDQFARVLFGARISLTVGFAAMLTITILGVVAGSIAGWIGGFTDFLLMRIIDVVLAFPYIVLALTIIAILGPSLVTIIVVFTIVGFGGTAKLLRAEILRLRNNDFIEAARASGVPSTRILIRHILPNAIPIVLTLAVGAIGDGIVGEAALSFLGRGIQEPQAAWGLMIARSRGFFSDSPHLLLGPGLALVILILAVVFIGDGVRDALDPKVDSRFL
jgi:peptide/nickel transport system permease protein